MLLFVPGLEKRILTEIRSMVRFKLRAGPSMNGLEKRKLIKVKTLWDLTDSMYIQYFFSHFGSGSEN